MQQGGQLTTRRLGEYIAALLLPIIIILSVFAVFGIYPFGEKTLLVVDMNSEYIDYFAYMHNAVRGEGSLLRSWNMGMGLNMIGLIAFYTASPFNLIMLAMPFSLITESVLIITVLKIGVCGLFFFVYAKNTFQLPWLWMLLFSTAYALMGYNVFYSSNLMWLDGVALLPLVVLGLNRLIANGKYYVLLASLVFVFCSSYYIGYMIALFSFLYITAVCIVREYSFRGYITQVGKLVGTGILAAACCAFLLLPAFFSLKNGYGSLFDISVSFQLKYGLTDLLTKLIPGTYDTLTDSALPNIYMSVFGAVMAAGYFMNGGVPVRERVTFGALMVIFALSMSCGFMDIAWHAFEQPTWYPARYSFLVPFMGLSLGLRGMEKHKNITAGKIIAAALILIAFITETAIKRRYFIDMREICVGLFLTAAYALLMGSLFSKKKRAIAVAMLGLLCAELWYSAYLVITGIDEQFAYKSREGYTAFMDEYSYAVGLLPEQGAEPYRAELVEQRNANAGMALGFNSISHYSSTTNQNLNELLYNMANNQGTINELRFSPGIPFASGLLGVKYVLSRRAMNGPYNYYASTGVVDVYENSLAFPLAYFADYEVLELDLSGPNPFELQNKWADSLGSDAIGDVFVPLRRAIEKKVNVTFENRETGQKYYERVDRNIGAYVIWEISNPSRKECYAYFNLYMDKFSRVKVWVNGWQVDRALAYRSNGAIPLGNEENIILRLELEGDNMNYADAFFYFMDERAARAVSSHANEGKAEFTVFRDTAVEASINAPSDGLMLTTFPFCEGWSIEVNGIKTKCESFAGVFAAIPVSKGENTIIMRYSPPGFIPGLCLSAASLIAVVLLHFYLKAKAKGKEG